MIFSARRCTIWKIIERRARQAGVRVHPHMFRHYAADGYLRDGVPEGAVMQMMGWSDRRMLDATPPPTPNAARWKPNAVPRSATASDSEDVREPRTGRSDPASD